MNKNFKIISIIGIILLILLVPLLVRANKIENAAVFVDPKLESKLNKGGEAIAVVYLKEVQSTNKLKNEDFLKLEKKDRLTEINKINTQRLDKLSEMISALPTQFNITRKSITGRWFLVKINKKILTELLNNPQIRYILLPQSGRVSLDESVPLTGANGVWDYTFNQVSLDGTGKRICVIDTGADDSHPSLSGKITAQQCFCTFGPIPETPFLRSNCCPNGNSILQGL